MRTKALLAWSSGKDSAWTLHVLRQQGEVDVVGLLTTVNQAFDRVAMHAVRRELLAVQAAAVGLPLRTVPIPSPCSNAEYEAAMAPAMERARGRRHHTRSRSAICSWRTCGVTARIECAARG